MTTRDPARTPPVWAVVVVVLLMVGWVLGFATLGARALDQFTLAHRDLAIFSQVARSAAHGGLLRTSLEAHGLVLQGGDSIAADVVRMHGGPSHFSSHFSPILWVLAIPWWLAPGPFGVQVVHWLALAGTAWLVFRLAHERLGHVAAVGLAAAYLFNPVTLQAGLDPFREVSLAAPALVGFALALHRDDRRGMAVAVLVMLTTKEDLALWCVGIGAALAIGGRRRVGLSIVAASAVALAVGVVVIGLARSGLASDHLLRYADLGSTPGAIVASVVFHPIDALSRAIDHARPGYLLQLLGPWAFAPLLSPWAALALLPVAANLLSALPEQHFALSYAHAMLAPLFAIATIDAAARVRDRLRHADVPGARRAAVAIAASVAGLLSLVVVVAQAWPSRVAATQPRLTGAERAEARAFIDSLEPDAGVMASFAFLPALADRDRLFAPWAVPGFVPDAVLLDVSEPMIWPWRDPAARLEFLKQTTAGYESRRIGRVLMFRRPRVEGASPRQ